MQKRICVRITTETGYSWKTEINTDIRGACKYFIGNHFDVGEYPEEQLERVVSVVKI